MRTLRVGIGRIVRRTRRSGTVRRRARFWGPGALVLAWWAVIGVVVVQTWPGPAVSAPRDGSALVPGQMVRIEQPGMTSWPIPVERAAFDELRRAYQESDEEAIERASAQTAWLWVKHGQAVKVETVDGEAVQIAILDGAEAGRGGWLLLRHLSGYTRK